ncbi:MAG: N-acetylglucosamine kinase [Ignavibacteriaceae bacterium]
MKYFIGIDGGGTKTQCVIANENREFLFECFGGPSNFIMIGTQVVSETLLSLINQCTEALKITPEDIESVVLGTTGAGRRTDAEQLEKDFLAHCEKQNVKINDFYVISDALAALEGAFSGKTGSILIAGTGSIMFGKDPQGVIHRVGGFGRFIGDEGSGYSLGKKGLAAVAKAFDGRGKETKLSEKLKVNFGINSLDDLITLIYKNNFDIASFAKVVIDTADEGDLVARYIIIDEIEELALHIQTMFDKFNVHEMRLVFIGSLIANRNIYSNALHDKMYTHFPKVKVIEPELNPAQGALIVGMERKGFKK